MYKVMYWYASLIGEKCFAKVEHYFTDSKKAIDYFFRMSKGQENIVLVVSTKHSEFVFLSHFSDDFPKDLIPNTFAQIVTEGDDTEVDGTDKTISMYDVYESICGFKRPKFKFNRDGSVEEI